MTIDRFLVSTAAVLGLYACWLWLTQVQGLAKGIVHALM